MPVIKCSNGKYRIGNGSCIYETEEKAHAAWAAIRVAMADSYNDYPQAARVNAQRAINIRNQYGLNCGTPVGWARATQLSQGSNITRETISRMASFERHRQNSKGDPKNDCGALMWLAWGGDEGIAWAQRKLEEIDKKNFAEIGERGGIKSSPKAPKSDTPNRNPEGEGSAKGDASGKRGAEVTEEQQKTLEQKVKDFNEKESNIKNGKATLGALKSVFQRGLGAFNTSHSPVVKSAEQWAYARVNAFLYLLKNGRPDNPKYTSDYDLLPKEHPKYQDK